MDNTVVGFLAVLFLIVLILVVKGIASSVKSEKERKARLAREEKERQEQEEEQRKREEYQRYLESDEYRQKQEKKRRAAERAQQREEEKTRQRMERLAHALEECPEARKYVLAEGADRVWAESELTLSQFDRMAKKCFVAVDTETTGLWSHDEIIEIAAVRVENGVITDEFHTMVNPLRSISAKATAVNGITKDMVANAPTIEEVLPRFLLFVGDAPIAAHNAQFDRGFIDSACSRVRLQPPIKYFDTMKLAKFWPDAENRKLGTLLCEAGIENEDAHRALGDARALVQLILKTNEVRGK